MAERAWPGADAWRERAHGIAPTIVGGSKKHGGPDLGPTRAREAWKRSESTGSVSPTTRPDPTSRRTSSPS